MKNIKKLSLFLVIALLISCFLGISAFAGDEATDKEYFVIDTDLLFARVPDDYAFDPYGGTELKTYNFADEDYSTISFLVFENKEMPEGVRKVTHQQAIDFIEENYTDYWEYVLDKVTVKKAIVNGVSALQIDGSTCFTEDYGNEEFYFGFKAYILATKENIFLVTFDSCDEAVDESDVNDVMNSLLVNGTYFEGDKLNATHDFSKALPFKEALENDVTVNDSSTITGALEELPENFIGIIIVVVIAIYILPTLVLIILAIVFGVKYNKNKKQLEEYQRRFGRLNSINYNMGNPVSTQAYPQAQPSPYMGQPGAYVNQAYNTPGAPVYGNNGSLNPQPPVNRPVPPVNMPTPSVQNPVPTQNPTTDSQKVSNLAPELQDSKADENK